MSAEGVISILALVIAVIAIADPVQRKSISLLIRIWIPIGLFLITFLIILSERYLVFFFCKVPWLLEITLTTLGLLLPIVTLALGYLKWSAGKIPKRRQHRFTELLTVAERENRYSEVTRLIGKNEQLTALDDTIFQQLFNESIVKELNTYPDWISLSLVRGDNLKNRGRAVFQILDSLSRDQICKSNSLIKKIVAKRFGGQEHVLITENEHQLFDDTYGNADWYIDYRADYSLLMAAMEHVNSSEITAIYNRTDTNYVRSQGYSSRINCPAYLFIQLHFHILEQAIKNNIDNDFYVSDYLDIVNAVMGRIDTDPIAWKKDDVVWTERTPFLYLIALILRNLRQLVEQGCNQSNDSIGRASKDVIRIYATTLYTLSNHDSHLPDNAAQKHIAGYFSLILQLLERSSADLNSPWIQSLANQLHKLNNNRKTNRIIFEAFEHMDSGMLSFIQHCDELKAKVLKVFPDE